MQNKVGVRCFDISGFIQSDIQKNYPIEVNLDKQPQSEMEIFDHINDCEGSTDVGYCIDKDSNYCHAGQGNTKLLPENQLFEEVLGQEIMLAMASEQLNILGQTFRPIFCGTVAAVTDGFLTLWPVVIKMSNAPFHRFPTPLNFPLERISTFVPFETKNRFPIP